MSDWRAELLKDDKRCVLGVQPAGSNANFAWVQHFIPHLVLLVVAGFVMVNSSMYTQTSGDGEIAHQLT